MMKHWKHYIPSPVKKKIRLLMRSAGDAFNGHRRKFARSNMDSRNLHLIVTITQPVYLTPASQNKWHNLQLAITRINHIRIQPGEIFSFWQLLGDPSEQKGYLPSRSLQDGELLATTGGGLCQLSGLLYYLALRSGLTILERHAHTVDIYTEAERFTPLGSDATVVYGYKDLRFRNDSGHDICTRIAIADDQLTGCFLSAGNITEQPVHFEYQHKEDEVLVITRRNDGHQVDTSVYKKLKSNRST